MTTKADKETMTTETILTDAQIIGILEENRPEYDGPDKAIDVSRAIEQAVLKSPEVQAWKKDAARYREVRKMSLRQFSEIYQTNLQTGEPFGLLVDAAMEKQP